MKKLLLKYSIGVSIIIQIFSFSLFSNAELLNRSINLNELWLPEEIDNDAFLKFSIETSKIHQKHLSLDSTTKSKEECHLAYDRFYNNLKNKSIVNWSVFFGFSDSEDESGRKRTTDISERYLFEKALTSNCIDGVFLCGFTKRSDGEFEKNINYKDHGNVSFRVHVFNASISSIVNTDNIEYIRTQNKNSDLIEKLFVDSFSKDDVVFYVGHARFGTGPGFRLLQKKSMEWIKAIFLSPMNAKLTSGLSGNGIQKVTTPGVIGFFMCSAEDHYGITLQTYAPQSAFFLTRQTTFDEDNLRSLFVGGNSLLGQLCEPEVKDLFNAATQDIVYNKVDGRPSPDHFDKAIPKFFNFYSINDIKGKSEIINLLKLKGGQDSVSNKRDNE